MMKGQSSWIIYSRLNFDFLYWAFYLLADASPIDIKSKSLTNISFLQLAANVEQMCVLSIITVSTPFMN